MTSHWRPVVIVLGLVLVTAPRPAGAQDGPPAKPAWSPKAAAAYLDERAVWRNILAQGALGRCSFGRSCDGERDTRSRILDRLRYRSTVNWSRRCCTRPFALI